jgi:hypothetical protein
MLKLSTRQPITEQVMRGEDIFLHLSRWAT